MSTFIIMLAIFISSVLIIFSVLVGYPLGLALFNTIKLSPKWTTQDQELPKRISVLIAARNAETLIEQKLKNSLNLEIRDSCLEVVVVSDGSTDNTQHFLKAVTDSRLKAFHCPEHRGKADALNKGISACTGDILVFTDVDALLQPDAILNLLSHFRDPSVGGVCGQRVIGERDSSLHDAQRSYVELDSLVKQLESKHGSITSNDGKLYAIRRNLALPIPAGVTDDLFNCLSVVRQGKRFVFEPFARAFVRLPSRTPGHELQRRMRIVARSLNGIWRFRCLLNPWHYGFYAIGLFINKVLRRLLPLCFIGVFLTSATLAHASSFMSILVFLQCAFYGAALYFPLGGLLGFGARIFQKVSGLAFYFVIGNIGTLFGLVTFLRGTPLVKWDPVKSS